MFKQLYSRLPGSEVLSLIHSIALLAKHAKPKFDSLEQEAYLGIWRTYDRLRSHEDALFATWSLTAQQYNVLRLVEAAGSDGLATLTIAARLVSKAPDITRMIDHLEKSQWITRTRSITDRRAVMITITAAGAKLLRSIAEPLAQCHQAQLGHLSRSELRTLVLLLAKARQPHEPEDSRWR